MLAEVGTVESSSGSGRTAENRVRPRLSVQQLLEAKNARPVRSLEELAADTFGSDRELDEFLALIYAERHRGLT